MSLNHLKLPLSSKMEDEVRISLCHLPVPETKSAAETRAALLFAILAVALHESVLRLFINSVGRTWLKEQDVLDVLGMLDPEELEEALAQWQG